FDLHGIERLSAGRLGDVLQHIVSLVAAGADVGADGIDDGVGALAHLDGVALLRSAVVVIAVGDENQGAAHRARLGKIQHLVAAGLVESVIERRTAAGPQLADSLVQQVDIIGKSLGNIGRNIEALDEGSVVEVQDLQQK